MPTPNEPTIAPNQRRPWNKGKFIGPKPPLQPRHVWAIRTRLQLDGRVRDLALFNLAIDSKLRGCDVVSLKVEDVAPHGYAIDRATVRQRKTGRPVKFEITEQTRLAVDDYLKASKKQPGDFLFTGRRGRDRCLTTRQYARLVSDWIAGSDWMRRCSAHTRCGERRRRSSTAAQAIYERCSYSSGIRRSRAPFDTWASRSMMLSPSPSRSISEPGGRAETLCPLLHTCC